MTPEIQMAWIEALPLILVALGGIIVPIVIDRRANRKLDHITVLTNSTLSTANARIEALEKMVEQLLAEQGRQHNI